MQKMSRIHTLRTFKGFDEAGDYLKKILPDDNQKGSGDSQKTQDKESKIQRSGSRVESVETNL